jgi:polysaccharide biosynthesis protein PslG
LHPIHDVKRLNRNISFKRTINRISPYKKYFYNSLALILLFGLFGYVYVTYEMQIKPSVDHINQTKQIPSNISSIKKPFGIALGDTLSTLSTSQLDTELAGIAKIGVGWIRIDISWADIQPNNSSKYDWNQLDQIVESAQDNKLHILGTIAYTPAWASPKSCKGDQKCAPASDTQFANFAGAVAKRYGSKGVQDFEIWNEPNLETFWKPFPSASAYTAMLKDTYIAIKQNDPSAFVISGGLGDLDNSSSSIPQIEYLTEMYADGAKNYFDAVGFHPYSFPALPSYTATWSGWSMIDSLPDSIRSEMIANGDGNKQIWITEYGAPTNGPGAIATPTNFNFENGPDHVNEALQAEMLSEATSEYKITPWLGQFFWYSYKDLSPSTSSNENFFGLLRYDGSPKPAYYAYQKAIR